MVHMIKFKFIFLFSFLLVYSCSSDRRNSKVPDKKNQVNSPKFDSNSIVIICHGEDAFAYHDHVCRGLRNCEASTEEVSVNEAVEMGRRPCGFCF
jgi:hypothetical protein